MEAFLRSKTVFSINQLRNPFAVESLIIDYTERFF